MTNAPPLEWPQGEPLFEVQMRALAQADAGDGVTTASDYALSAGTGSLELDVATGTYLYQGTTYSTGSTTTLSVSGGDGTYDRWDTIYLDLSDSTPKVNGGTAAASPEPPLLTADNQALLGVVYVPQNATSIGASNILNWRLPAAAQAGVTLYDDSTGQYGATTVDGALDELQEAAQVSAYPLSLATDTEASAYPLANTDLANSSVTVAGNSVSLGGTTAVSLADLDTKPHSSLDDAPASAHHRAHTQPGDQAATADITDDQGNTVYSYADQQVPRAVVEQPVITDQQFFNLSANTARVFHAFTLADGETVTSESVTFLGPKSQAVPSGVDLALVNPDGAGAYTTESTIISGDGSTRYIEDTGAAPADFTNSSGSQADYAYLVDNTTSGAEDVLVGLDAYRV